MVAHHDPPSRAGQAVAPLADLPVDRRRRPLDSLLTIGRQAAMLPEGQSSIMSIPTGT